MTSFTYCCNMADAIIEGLTITESLTLDLLVRETLDAADFGSDQEFITRHNVLSIVASAYGMPYLKVSNEDCKHVMLSSVPFADDIDDIDDDEYDEYDDDDEPMELDDESISWFNRYNVPPTAPIS